MVSGLFVGFDQVIVQNTYYDRKFHPENDKFRLNQHKPVFGWAVAFIYLFIFLSFSERNVCIYSPTKKTETS